MLSTQVIRAESPIQVTHHSPGLSKKTVRATRSGADSSILFGTEHRRWNIRSLQFLIFVMSASRVRGFTRNHFLSSQTVKSRLVANQKPQTAIFQNRKSLDMEIMEMEKEVIATTNAKLDLRRISNALEPQDTGLNPDAVANSAAPWQLGIAASITVSAAAYVATGSSILAGIAFAGSFFVAIGDPVEEEGVAGSAARLLGRQTIKSVESSKPKIRALVQAITDEERITKLEGQVEYLQKENARLELWQKRRIAVDDSLSKYTLDELKERARRGRLPVGGTKAQLLMRLVENEAIDLDIT